MGDIVEAEWLLPLPYATEYSPYLHCIEAALEASVVRLREQQRLWHAAEAAWGEPRERRAGLVSKGMS